MFHVKTSKRIKRNTLLLSPTHVGLLISFIPSCSQSVYFLYLSLSGWIVSLAALKTSVPVGAIMMMNAILFTAQSAMGVVMLKRVKTE